MHGEERLLHHRPDLFRFDSHSNALGDLLRIENRADQVEWQRNDSLSARLQHLIELSSLSLVSLEGGRLSSVVLLYTLSICDHVNLELFDSDSACHRLGQPNSTTNETEKSTQTRQTPQHDDHAAFGFVRVHSAHGARLDFHGLRASVEEPARAEISVVVDDVLLDLLHEHGGELSALFSHGERFPSRTQSDDFVVAVLFAFRSRSMSIDGERKRRHRGPTLNNCLDSNANDTSADE